MTDMHDDAADQIVDQFRTRLFTGAVYVDGTGLTATPPHSFETRPGCVLDVQAIIGGDDDGGDLIYVAGESLTRIGAAALRDHLSEVLRALL